MAKKSAKKSVNKKSTNMGAFIAGFALIGLIMVGSSFALKPENAGNKGGNGGNGGGNGAPNGQHFNLNVIGVPKNKSADITSGGRIFVPLDGNCRVKLAEGDFAVVDGNCTDGSSAFNLPNPDPDGDGTTEYTVWARPLGKPGGKAKVTTCGTDPLTGEEICSIESSAFIRTKGKSSFENKSKEFLTVLADLDGDETTAPERVGIFDPALEDYMWSYDNKGLRILQVRFYEQTK